MEEMEVSEDCVPNTKDLPEYILIMQDFPLLSSWNDNTYWTGFIQGINKLLRISLTVPNFPVSRDGRIGGDKETSKVLAPLRPAIDKIIAENVGVVELLRRILSLVNGEDGKDAGFLKSIEGSPGFFIKIFDELDTIGIENVDYASKNFEEIRMKYDHLGIKHVVTFKISSKYPEDPINVMVDLPPPSDGVHWPKDILSAYQRFKVEVDRYIVFWSVLDELDNQARVIDPTIPKRGHIHRKILLNQNIVVNLVFNPLCPKILPEIKFSGPEKDVLKLETLVDQNCQDWSEGKSILENLEDILNTEFLLKNEMEDDQGQESGGLESLCVVCYAFEFEGNTPETTCECGSLYHDKCLSDLLINDCSVKAKRYCVDCPVCGMVYMVERQMIKTLYIVRNIEQPLKHAIELNVL